MGALFSWFQEGPPEGHLRVHARLGASARKRAPDDAAFGLHVWGPSSAAPTPWDAPLAPAGEDWFGPYFDVPLTQEPVDATTGGPSLGVLLHAGEDKRCSLELASDAEARGMLPEVWFGHGGAPITTAPLPADVPVGDLASGGARAHWLQEGLIAWRAASTAPAGSRVRLHSSAAGRLRDAGAGGVENGDTDEEGGPFVLDLMEGGLLADVVEKHPYLKGCAALSVPHDVHARALCRRQLALSLEGPDGEVLDCTGVQLGALLDDLFAYLGPLGCFPTSVEENQDTKRPRYGGAFRRTRSAVPEESNGVTLAMWSPAAQEVSVNFYDGPQGEKIETVAMERSNDGVWRARGSAMWWDRYYTYQVKAFHPQAKGVVSMETPDPYSRACSADSARTLACHLPVCVEAVPGGNVLEWQGTKRPEFSDRGRAVVYELHIRDFSAMDESVPADRRGKYLAFEEEGTCGDLHLRKLAAAGLTHVQLLPNYDFGSVPERQENQRQPVIPDGLAPDSEAQQAAAVEAADTDAFNWGYDPVLYDVPEGSYASDPDGLVRVLEHRRMVAALHKKGLRVVVDVVYNHTLASGPDGALSVLDKCAPGYYYRRSESGEYENSTCMNNTAGERAMMGRLVVDSVVHWAKMYRVDGFRFDLMGHLPLSVVEECRRSLDALTVEKDGVDGPRVLMYGEGWEFGEIAGDQRGRTAVQRHLAGTGVGSFNDRVRDAAIGGSPFTDPRQQGLMTGLYLRPWPEEEGVPQGDKEQQLRDLLVSTDKVRIALMGSLRKYTLREDCAGVKGVLAEEAHGGLVAYTAQPEEIVNYVSAHDNETLYDNTVWKMPSSLFTPEERMRANWLCSAIVIFANGIPFIHAGDEVLRSKSLDRDSYNSGDWFNLLDFSGKRSAFGTGLPPKGKNGEKWEMMRPMLRDASLRPTPEMAAATTSKICEFLQVRRSTPLIGLTRAEDVLAKLDFPGCGAAQEPGVIVMQVRNGPSSAADGGDSLLCPSLARVVVVLSARLEEVRVPVPEGGAAEDGKFCEAGKSPLKLHPLQAKSDDPATRLVRVEGSELVLPPQAAVVFVEALPGQEAWLEA